MRIAEYKQIDTEKQTTVVHHDAVYDEDENGRYGVISEAYDETVEIEVPVMGMVYRDATLEEEVQMRNEEIPEIEPTPEERIAKLEEENATLLECLLEMSEIVYA